MTESTLYEVEPLRAVIREIIGGFGSLEREARLVSDNLVRANLTGHDSHGVGMVPRYVQSYRAGQLRPNAELRVDKDAGPLLALDGRMGFGQSIGCDAMEMAIGRAKRHGICAMALSNAHHLGRIGEWAEMATAEGLVAIHFVNAISRPIVAPWGGTDARLGTNPFTVGVPIQDKEPLILDFATSMIAQGKARVAYNKGDKLAPGMMLDDKGQPTVDPVYGVKPPLGALLTLGEHKGFGLSLVCELLGGALAGGLSVNGPADGKPGITNGMLTILIDPAQLGSEGFHQFTEQTLAWVKASPPAAGTQGVQMAGEPERASTAKRTANGIPVDAQTWSDILDAGAALGLDRERLQERMG
jgi:uncharacterized oxidoreductase